jgi:hypothetical protein
MNMQETEKKEVEEPVDMDEASKSQEELEKSDIEEDAEDPVPEEDDE